ncbi:MAG: WYL domain-containing protein [Clostridia bacterium]|nr:WYL domain-containing protein [Clostridia bacterium]
MIFSELYSVYYNAVARILTRLINEDLKERDIEKIVKKEAFEESYIFISDKIKSGKWQIITEDFTTPIINPPTMPLTNIQRRWLKSISLDPRIKLFNFSFKGLEDIEPLFTAEDYKVYDKYSDGDNFEDEEYIKNFRILLNAIENEHTIKIEYISGKNNRKLFIGLPNCLEYSEKDDKFRLLAVTKEKPVIINLSRIVKIEKRNTSTEVYFKGNYEATKKYVTIKVTDKSNALERCMIHFAHFEKKCEKIDENNYILNITYNETDENEVLIRILSFGAKVEVIEPQEFRQLVIERLKKQKSYEI